MKRKIESVKRGAILNIKKELYIFDQKLTFL